MDIMLCSQKLCTLFEVEVLHGLQLSWVDQPLHLLLRKFPFYPLFCEHLSAEIKIHFNNYIVWRDETTVNWRGTLRSRVWTDGFSLTMPPLDQARQ